MKKKRRSRKKQPHKQVELVTKGQIITLDEGVVELVKVMNSSPGIVTYYSCQGNDTGKTRDLGYVFFGGTFAKHLTTLIVAEALNSGFASLTIEGTTSSTTDKDGVCLRWNTCHYQDVLAYVRSAANVLKKLYK